MNATVPNRALQMPGILWVAVVALGGFGLVQLGFGVTGMPTLALAGGLAILLAVGLSCRQRWAHVMTLVACLITPIAALIVGEFWGAGLIALFNAVVAVPLVMTNDWFWKRESLPEWLA